MDSRRGNAVRNRAKNLLIIVVFSIVATVALYVAVIPGPVSLSLYRIGIRVPSNSSSQFFAVWLHHVPQQQPALNREIDKLSRHYGSVGLLSVVEKYGFGKIASETVVIALLDKFSTFPKSSQAHSVLRLALDDGREPIVRAAMVAHVLMFRGNSDGKSEIPSIFHQMYDRVSSEIYGVDDGGGE